MVDLRKKFRACPGQSLSEYAIISGVILVLVIPALTFLGKDISSAFSGILSMKDSSAKQGATTPATEAPASSESLTIPTMSLGANNSSLLPSTGLNLVTAKGTVIAVPEYSQDIANTVLTAGANGATEMLANTIKTVADQALAAGEITESQYNVLIELANQGHYLGDIAGAVEEAAKISTNGTDFHGQPLVINGQEFTMAQLSKQIGYANYDLFNAQAPPNPLIANEPANPALQKFIDLYNTAKTNGALSDPAISSLVYAAASNITIIHQSMNETRHDLHHEAIAVGDFTNSMVSGITHANSVNICAAGNGTDSGIYCAN